MTIFRTKFPIKRVEVPYFKEFPTSSAFNKVAIQLVK